jgi:large subunit ribosomal protein L24
MPAGIRKGDEVQVISGKDRGRKGRVLRVDPARERVIVEGVNIVKRHQRATPGRPDAIAGVIEREGSVHVSNVALLDPKDGKPTRIGFEVHEGKRYRVARRSGSRID